MSTTQALPRTRSEELLARLTSAAYEAALRHGFQGSFLEVELEIWRALRRVLEQEAPAGVSRARTEETAIDLPWSEGFKHAV